MLRTTKLLALPMIAAGLLLLVDVPETQAQGFRVQIGGFGINAGGAYRGGYRGAYVNRGGHNFYSNQPRAHSAYRHNYGHQNYYRPHVQSYGYHGGNYRHYGNHGYYHDTTHFDYHPPEIYRHGNHYDIQPGHYDLHRSGHYHH